MALFCISPTSAPLTPSTPCLLTPQLPSYRDSCDYIKPTWMSQICSPSEYPWLHYTCKFPFAVQGNVFTSFKDQDADILGGILSTTLNLSFLIGKVEIMKEIASWDRYGDKKHMHSSRQSIWHVIIMANVIVSLQTLFNWGYDSVPPIYILVRQTIS